VIEDPMTPPPADYAEITRRLLLQHYAPASVLADRDGTVLYVHGDTGPYLRQAPGRPTLSLVEMAREGLQADLRAAIQRAGTKAKPVLRPGLPVGAGAQARTVDLTVRPAALAKGVPAPAGEFQRRPGRKPPAAEPGWATPPPAASRSCSGPSPGRTWWPPSRSSRPSTSELQSTNEAPVHLEVRPATRSSD
jgi:hypothetical protein